MTCHPFEKVPYCSMVFFVGLSDHMPLQSAYQSKNGCLAGQVAQRVRMVGELQQNQRVAVRREHVVRIRFHDEETY